MITGGLDREYAVTRYFELKLTRVSAWAEDTLFDTVKVVERGGKPVIAYQGVCELSSTTYERHRAITRHLEVTKDITVTRRAGFDGNTGRARLVKRENGFTEVTPKARANGENFRRTPDQLHDFTWTVKRPNKGFGCDHAVHMLHVV